MATVTYSPEDNKIRLYVGRVPRDEYKQLRAAGFVSTPKQSCDFVATWTPNREDLAREYLEDGEDIGDEGYSPEERAADRAERFGGYRDKRAAEAGVSADVFEAGPQAFGAQSLARAERQARRHDRSRVYAVSQWAKAEYWQERTRGVIANALYKSSPSVRRGRILTIEADLRRCSNSPRWAAHLAFRLEYEKAMLANEGGMVSEADIEPGGWIRPSRRQVAFGHAHVGDDGFCQVLKVFKSPATGRVTSVQVMGDDHLMNDREVKPRTINIERLGENCYRPPTDEEREKFAESVRAAKAERKATAPKSPPLINPTNEDAERLQAHWNAKAAEKFARARYHGEYVPTSVKYVTQAEYSANSKGSYSKFETVEVREHGHRDQTGGWYNTPTGCTRDVDESPVAFKVRKCWGSGIVHYKADAVVVITDRPQKPIPLDWEAIEAEAEPATV